MDGRPLGGYRQGLPVVAFGACGFEDCILYVTMKKKVLTPKKAS